MFAAINVPSGAEESREGGETAEAQSARVAATYERALLALRDGHTAEAQSARLPRAAGLRGACARACAAATGRVRGA
jgi:hypothetical protein